MQFVQLAKGKLDRGRNIFANPHVIGTYSMEPVDHARPVDGPFGDADAQ